MLDGLPLAVVGVDVDGLVRYCNDAATGRLGWDVHSLLNQSATTVLFGPESAGTFDEVVQRVMAGGRWTGPIPVFSADHWSITGTSWCPARSEGQVVGVLVFIDDLESTTTGAQRLAGRLRKLAEVTTGLLAADDMNAVTALVTEHIADAVGASVSSLSLLVDEHTLALIAVHGGLQRVTDRWSTYPLAAVTPVGDSLRERRVLVVTGRDEIARRYPDLELVTAGERSLVCLPLLVAGDRGLGAVTLSFPGIRTFDAAELAFLRSLADTCAQAIDRIRALETAADREVKLRFLAEASAELGRSLDYEATLTRVAWLAVPGFADWCVIHLLLDGELRPLAVAHPDAFAAERVRELQDSYPPDPTVRRGAYEVARTGVSELVSDITDELLVQAATGPEHLQVLRELNFRSAMQVPLMVGSRVLGVITWVAGTDGRRYTAEDLAFGEDLARRAAVAIDNAELHSQLRDVARRVQRAALPRRVPDVPGWEAAAVYLPAGRTDIGGDFYDVVPLDDGRVVAFVGDVMGRGVEAAAAMAQTRSAVRALLAADPGPAAVMAGLDRFYKTFDTEQLVTLVYALSDPRSDEVQIINAGHPAPLLVRADGSHEEVSTSRTLLLGVDPADRAVITRALAPGDTLLMFTDGLVERRGENLDQGHRRVQAAAAFVRASRLDHGLAQLVESVRDPERDDDIAVLALRRRPTSRT